MKSVTNNRPKPAPRKNTSGPRKGQDLTNGRTPGSISPRPHSEARASLHRWFRVQADEHEAQRQSLQEFESRHGLNIPSAGIIDHARISLLHPVVERDRARLCDLGFVPTAAKLRAKRGPGDFVYDAEPGSELLVRESDGCRVNLWNTRIASTVSLARILGMTNDLLHELTERDVSLACFTVTKQLFPWTTRVAGLLDREWGSVELALAVDVRADARAYADIYENTRWKRTRGLPKRYRNGLAWSGSNNRLTTYDKGEEMRRRGIPGAPPRGTVMRVEREWRGARAVDRLGESIAHSRGPRIPLVGSNADGVRTVFNRPVDHRVLHQLMALELSVLDTPTALRKSRQDVIAAQMVKDSSFRHEMQLVSDRKTNKNDRQRMLAIELEQVGLPTLLQATYGEAAIRVCDE